MQELKITITITDPEFLGTCEPDHEDIIEEEVRCALEGFCTTVEAIEIMKV